jgi:hypothetical protein
MDLEEYFATGPEWERPIFDAVRAHLEALGPLHIEPVSVGIFFKRDRTFVELRPMARWTAVSMMLPRLVQDPRISRKPIQASRGAWYHVVNVRSVDEVDAKLLGWLTESYLATEEPNG